MKLLTTAQAAAELGVTPSRVLALINAGRLPAQKFGHAYLIQKKDLAKVKNRKVGRPPKKK
jgi:excisionase family DNA binding protein